MQGRHQAAAAPGVSDQTAETGLAQLEKEAIMAWHERAADKRPACLVKLKLPPNVKRAIAAVPLARLQGRLSEGLVQLAELELRIQNWNRSRRVVVERTLKPLNPSLQGTFWNCGEEEFAAFQAPALTCPLAHSIRFPPANSRVNPTVRSPGLWA